MADDQFPPMWAHTFNVAQAAPQMFQHRNPQDWLRDVADVAGFSGQYVELTAWPHDSRDPHYALEVHCTGTQAVLRFLCVLFNQHAEQSPGDATPVGEADRLEATLAQPGGIPCPDCGLIDGWEAYIELHAYGVVYSDHSAAIDTTSVQVQSVGSIRHRECSKEVPLDTDLGRYLEKQMRAIGTLQNTKWAAALPTEL